MNRINALAVFLVVSIAAFGQGGSSISGIVRDPAGAPIPAVQLQVTNQDTGVAFELTTNDEGAYRTIPLAPGAYRIDARKDGFERLVRGPLTLQVGQALGLDLELSLGRQSDTITVTEEAPVVETQTSNVTQTVSRQMLAGLPLPNRAASSLALLSPGVVMVDSGVGTAENYPIFSIAGGRVRNQSFVLDGGNVTNATGLTRPQQLVSLPVDAMQEFTVISNNYSAEYGHSTGGVVSMSTRSGTNQYHGSVFESLKNNAFDARNYFAAAKPPIRLNQFGGSFGGPVQKDKTHFFATWERTEQLTSETVASTVPTLANRAGNFGSVAIYDPATTVGTSRQLFPGNVIPITRFDPVALRVLDYYPLPNRVGTAAGARNYSGNSANRLNRDIVMGRLDHQLDANNVLTARYYINDSATHDGGTYGIPVADPTSNITDVRVQSFLGSYTHIFGPTLINDLKFTHLQRKFINTRPGYLDNLAKQLGLQGVTDAAFPAFTVPGYATLGNPAGAYRIQTPILDRQVLDSIAWFRGKHSFKFGAEFRAGANDEVRDRGSAGNFTISPLITSLPGVAGTGNAVASLLLGEVNAASIQVSDKIRSRSSYIGVYAQDDFRVTSRLTLNIGLRWETELPRREADNKMNSFDPLAINPVSGTLGVVTFAGLNSTPVRAFRTDKNNVGPRAGFAYRLRGKRETVIRGGAGIFYASTVSNSIGDSAALGFSTQASLVVPQADLQSAMRLRDGFPAVTRLALTPGFAAVPFGARPTTAVSFFNPGQVSPISYQYNLSVQQEASQGLLVEAGYIGNVSHNLTANDFSLNQVRPELMGAGNAQTRRPFPQFSNVTWINPSIGNSSYHGGFLRTERRFRTGLSFLAHYTFSKFLDDVASSDEYGDPGSYQDAYNRRLDKARSGSDVPHRFLLTVLYETPQVRGHRFVSGAIGGWKVGVLETAQSGSVFTVTNLSNTTNAFPAGSLRPNILRDASLSADQRSVNRWFDTAAFVAPDFFTFGNSPRSGLRGAPVLTTDVTLEKSLRVHERWKFDLRGEFYNVLNHANFNAPGHVLGAPEFGVVTSARPGRTAQLSGRLSF